MYRVDDYKIQGTHNLKNFLLKYVFKPIQKGETERGEEDGKWTKSKVWWEEERRVIKVENGMNVLGERGWMGWCER
jgi:hypothetical protein